MNRILMAVLFTAALQAPALAATHKTHHHKKAKIQAGKPLAASTASKGKKGTIVNQGPVEPVPGKARTPLPDTVALKPVTSKAGYIARMLINEPAFPGEKGWVSEEDSKAAMLAMLWVCHARIHYIPPGYTQRQVAAAKTTDIIDILTAGGEKGQVDGFYRDKNGDFRILPRILRRVDDIVKAANTGEPGRFSRLVQHAQGLADAYVTSGIAGADRYAELRAINGVRVTGRAYSWMTDEDYYHPGGNFVRIPNDMEGSLGANRFFSLKELRKK